MDVIKFTTPHCGMAMLASSANVTEKLILPGDGLMWQGFWASLGTSGGLQLSEVLQGQVPRGSVWQVTEVSKEWLMSLSGLRSEFLVARTPENMVKWTCF